jgi:hypothetical protein
VGGRIDKDVAGRASTRGAEAGALRNVEAMRPATVAGLGGDGGLFCGDFFVGTAIGAAFARTDCRSFEAVVSAGCLKGCGLGMVAVRVRATDVVPCMPFVMCPVR